MKALILNSGVGSRMGALTARQPKCMTEISSRETYAGIEKVVITTGPFDDVLVQYVQGLSLPLDITFVHNDKFQETNYIYSIYQAREYLQGTDLLLMHGDMVFENAVFDRLVAAEGSNVAASSTAPLPRKDFKAVINNGKVEKIGVEFFDRAMASQPLYKLTAADWQRWLEKIAAFCEPGKPGATQRRR